MACLCCTCLNCTVVTFWYSSCLAVFTVQTVVTVYLDFLPCFCAAALASGRLPGSNSMCTSMFRLGLQPAEDIRWSSPHPRLRFGAICKLAYVNVLSLSLCHSFSPFLSSRLFLFISFRHNCPPLPWAGWVARLERSSLKNILCYLNTPLSSPSSLLPLPPRQ